jgi:cation diffusion facilitator CzcD-associated flavoprotein CzcO
VGQANLNRTPAPSILVIGSGFAGLCLAMQLKRAGIHSFTILEKEGDIGGTWRDNVYPGAACDVPSFLYCFSFEQKTDWTRKWSPEKEILEYIRHSADKYDLWPHIRLRTEVVSARFDASQNEWVVRTSDGLELRARFLVSATGQLNRPSIPQIDGLEQFAGASFHSARWRHDVSLSGRSVAVIGNAASAVQFIPELAKQVAQLTVFQRSPNWMLPKNDRVHTEREIRLFSKVPLLARLYRSCIWLGYEARFPALGGNRVAQRAATFMALRHLESQVPDAVLRKALVPDYPIGAKRILISDDYYPALARSNVSLVTNPIERVTPTGVVTRDGVEHPADVLVFATGFESTAFLTPMEIEGPSGRTLGEAWRDGAEAYLGLTVAGFPNFFVLYGPNTNLGHNSILFMLECQTNYVLACLERMDQNGLSRIDLLPGAQRDYNALVQRKLAKTVWTQIDASWYKTKTGRITNNWYGPTWQYWRATRRVDWSAYVVSR